MKGKLWKWFKVSQFSEYLSFFFIFQKYGPDTGGKGTARVLRDELQDLDKQNTDLKQEVRDLQQDLASERRTAEKVRPWQTEYWP